VLIGGKLPGGEGRRNVKTASQWFPKLSGEAAPTPLPDRRLSPCFVAGEKFVAWTKNCKEKPFLKCLKEISAHKTPVKSGAIMFRAEAFSSWHCRC
jgi:hypothetical protein